RSGNACAQTALRRQCPRLILLDRKLLTGLDVIPQLHDVVEIAVVVGAPDLKDVHQPVVQTRYGFELLDAFEFPVETMSVLQGSVLDHFHRAVTPQLIASEPDPSKGALPNLAYERVVSD